MESMEWIRELGALGVLAWFAFRMSTKIDALADTIGRLTMVLVSQGKVPPDVAAKLNDSPTHERR